MTTTDPWGGGRADDGHDDGKGLIVFFFFKAGGRRLCIDAQTHPCPCHPGTETVGRKMNHSRKNPNVRPVHCNLQFDDGEKDTVLLVAMKDIAVGQELRFDYGVKRQSFGGEGLDLEWLDE